MSIRNRPAFYLSPVFKDFMMYFLGYAFITGIQFTYANALFELNGVIIPLAQEGMSEFWYDFLEIFTDFGSGNF